ncbi:AAA family ATPase [Paraburkholderia sp. A3BS-1L]|uniref:AAA family ATPase n=1 Tax=Paraburkholderia sp. A3BS-1L TaxID=3028375 RepID=UPI003DA9DF2B
MSARRGHGDRRVVISGCSGGGKSALLAELAQRGHAVVEEPGRRIVEAELRSNGHALPWVDLRAFLLRAIDLAHADLASVDTHGACGWIFFDRGLIDALAARAHLEGRPLNAGASGTQRHYHHRVFVTPPWPEIYVQDDARRHDFASATQEYERLLAAWPSFGYKITLVPKTDVAARADFVLRTLQDDLDARGEGIDAL